ncbi:MAG TPA: BON domain-containing protein [Verrucomicrobiae bacterium]|nr:BON domain-containing protein [Verrucomicrobiae bacterium]
MSIKTNTVSLALCLGLLTAGAVGTVTGCAGTNGNRSTGQYIDDKATAMRVRDALHDNPEYKFDQVNVSVLRGTVQLSGFVPSDSEKTKAGNIAKNTSGVKNVVNNITVTSSNNNNGNNNNANQ